MYDNYKSELAKLLEKDQYRTLKSIDKSKFVNLSSNDYLGIAGDGDLLKEFYSYMDNSNLTSDFAPGSTSSRLLTGNYELYDKFEERLADLYSQNILTKKEAIVFNSGYHTNIGILPALTTKRDLILSDKLNHASIIDGLRLADADFLRYQHLDYDQLISILQKKRNNYRNVFIVSESVFSMDGDRVDLQKLVNIKKEFNAFLYIDEAHSFGVFGETGLGLCEQVNLISEIDIIIGTFGKAFASQGAFAIVDKVLKEYLINKARSLIFTTALPPVVMNWNFFLLEKLASFSDRRKNLLDLSDKLREELNKSGFATIGDTHIIPVILGENDKAVKAASDMQSNGFLLFAIRPPTVPPGSARLRISLTADLKWDDVKGIIKHL